MPINDRGFSPLLILIIATIILAVVAGGAYFLQRNKSESPAAVIPISSLPPSPIPSNEATSSAILPSPTPRIASSLTPTQLSITQITQPDCNSTSCGDTTVLIITGTGFSNQTQLSATGETNGNPYSGILSQVNSGGSEIDFDLLNIPCQTYTATLTSPMPSGSSATFTFYPKKC